MKLLSIGVSCLFIFAGLSTTYEILIPESQYSEEKIVK